MWSEQINELELEGSLALVHLGHRIKFNCKNCSNVIQIYYIFLNLHSVPSQPTPIF